MLHHRDAAPLPAQGYASRNAQSDDFVVDDVRVGATDIGYFDPEFLSEVNRMVYQTSANGVQQVWIADLNPLTGLTLSTTGKDVLVDTNVALIGPQFDTTNGPEWGLDSEGVAVFYSKRDADSIVQYWRASNLLPGAVDVMQLTHVPGPNGEGAIMGIARKDASRPTTQFIYRYIQAPRFKVEGPARWADETAPDAINDFPRFNGAAAAPSWIEGTDDFVYAMIVAPGKSEIARFNTVSATATVLTSDTGAKYNIHAFKAPELNGELLIGCVIDRTRFVVFRSDGTRYIPWAELAPPDSGHPYMISPEVFHAGGMTYFAVQMSSNNPDNIGGLPPGTDCAMWIIGLDTNAANQFARRVDEGAVTAAKAYRFEPEVYVGETEVFLYYNLGTTLRRARTGISRDALWIPEITEMSLSGAIGAQYSRQLSATGGVAPYRWTIESGSLPPGLTLDSNGTLAGLPTTDGVFIVTFRVTDFRGVTATRSVRIVITSTTGLNDIPVVPALHVAPNPARNAVHITSASDHVVMYDLFGRAVWQGSAHSTMTVDLSDMPVGMYIVRGGGTTQRLLHIR